MKYLGSLAVAGFLALSPATLATAEPRGEGGEVRCLFAEPQFKSKLVDTIIEGIWARSGVIDPLGATLDAGPDPYFQLIQAMGKSVADCLKAR